MEGSFAEHEMPRHIAKQRLHNSGSSVRLSVRLASGTVQRGRQGCTCNSWLGLRPVLSNLAKQAYLDILCVALLNDWSENDAGASKLGVYDSKHGVYNSKHGVYDSKQGVYNSKLGVYNSSLGAMQG